MIIRIPGQVFKGDMMSKPYGLINLKQAIRLLDLDGYVEHAVLTEDLVSLVNRIDALEDMNNVLNRKLSEKEAHISKLILESLSVPYIPKLNIKV